MAQFKLLDFVDLGTQGYHDHTSWKVTTDAAGVSIIDQSLNDPTHIYNWQSPLPDGAGGYYADLSAVYLWIKVHINNTESPWFRVTPANQNDQQFKITENGVVVNTVNSLVAGIQ